MAANLFSVAALFIIFRECLEASIVIAIMLQMCKKLNLEKLKRWVWFGALAGISLALAIGVVIIIIFYVAKNSVFQGNGKTIFKGFINLVAAFLITLVAFAMLKFKNYEQKWELKLNTAASKQGLETRGKKAQLFLLSFSAVFREGLETVVFLAGISASTPVQSIPLAGLVGVILGCSVGIFLYYTGRQIKDISWFFYIMCGLLFFIAAGLTASAVNSWQSVGWYGTWLPVPSRPVMNKILWDWSRCCSSDINANRFFGLVSAIFGYQSQVTPAQILAYFGYWVELLIVLGVKSHRGRLTDAMAKHKACQLANPGPADPALGPLPVDKAAADVDAPAVTPLPVHKDVELVDAKHKGAESSGGSGSSGQSVKHSKGVCAVS